MGQKDPEKLYWEREPEVLIAGIYTSVSGYIFQHHRIAKHAKPCLRSRCFLLEEQQSSYKDYKDFKDYHWICGQAFGVGLFYWGYAFM
jgi:hypothetical protein